MADGDSPVTDGSPRTKVGCLIAANDMVGIGAELERRWTAAEGERDSLRTLADVFNRRLLERRLLGAGVNPIDGEADNLYRLLTDDEVSRGVETEVSHRLERDGLDVDALREEFVTYQSVRTYLTEVRGASYEASERTVDQVRSTVDRLAGRTTGVTEQSLGDLQATGNLTLGSVRVRTAVTVYCTDCETQYEVTDLLASGGCRCVETE